MNRSRAVDIGFVCLGLVLAAMAVGSYVHDSRPEVFPAGSELPVAYQRSPSGGQLLLAFRSDCGFCIKGVPFYTKLAAYCKRAGIEFRVITLESPKAVRAILAADDERDLDIVQMSRFDFRGTPAIVLADARNRVVASWMGGLSPQLERRVINAVATMAER